MVNTIFRSAWRSLSRNRLHTAVNVGGLVIGFTIGIAVLLVVYSQLSYDSQHVHSRRIYEAYIFSNGADGPGINNQFDYSAGPVIRAEAPAVERSARFVDGGSHLNYKNRSLDIPVMMADEDLFRMFTFKVVRGNASNPLGKLTDIVLTEETAKKIFGNEDPIGQQLVASAGEKLKAYTVSAVVKDPQLSTVKFEMLTRIENRGDYTAATNHWDNHFLALYVELKEGATQREAEQQLRLINHRYQADVYTDLVKKGAKPDPNGDIYATRLLPLRKAHFSVQVNGHKATSYMMVYTLLLVGLLVIAIASFNFVNINLATAFTRSREIGVRKCLGAGRNRLFGQLWFESFMICALAFVLSLLLTNVLLRTIDGIQRMNIPLGEILLNPRFLGVSVVLLLFVALVAGGYPSWMMSRFNTVETLKGKLGLKRKSGLRSSLIVAQFVIACVMICCTFVVYRQFRHLQDADLGMDKSFLVSIPLRAPEKGRETVEKLRTALASDPRVLSVSGSNINMGRGADRKTVSISTGFDYKGKSVSTDRAWIDYGYLKTLGIPLVAGREFDKSYGTDTADNVILSESMAKQLHEKDVVGKTIIPDGETKGMHVVGVFADFHLYSMAQQIRPLTLSFAKGGLDYCFVKTTAAGAIGLMERLKKEMAVLEPGQEFRASFVDDNVNDWYTGERMMSLFFGIAAGIAILLSCMGLLAMVLLIVNQRVKEIGVRKVLGASVRQISVLISREFLGLVALAVVIATPLSWLVMSQWLREFPYRVALEWWMFAVVGATALGLALLTVGFHVVRAAMANPVKNLRTE